MRTPISAPAGYAAALAATAQMTVNELNESEIARVAWQAEPRPGDGQVLVLILEEGDTLETVVAGMLRAGRELTSQHRQRVTA